MRIPLKFASLFLASGCATPGVSLVVRSNSVLSTDRIHEQVERPSQFEFMSDPVAKRHGVSLASVDGFYLHHGLAVRRDHLRDHSPRIVLVETIGTDWKLTAATQCVESGTFRLDSEAGVGVLEEGDGIANAGVASFVGGVFRAAGFEGKCSLARGRAHLGRREALVNRFGALEAIDSGGGKDESIAFSVGQLLQASVDIAANLDEGDIGSKSKELSAPARAGGTDPAACGKGVERPVRLANPHIAGVGAFGNGGKRELWRQSGRKIFEAVDGKIDPSLFERFFYFLDEDALAVETWRWEEAGLLHPVAGGANDLEFGMVASVAECIEYVVGLPKGELRASAADADGGFGMVRHPNQNTAEARINAVPGSRDCVDVETVCLSMSLTVLFASSSQEDAGTYSESLWRVDSRSAASCG
jgi:hypothetical protein